MKDTYNNIHTSFGESSSSRAFVSVAVPYSSVPHTYNVLYPLRRQYLRQYNNYIILEKVEALHHMSVLS